MDRRHFLAVFPALAFVGCASTTSEKPVQLPSFSAAERELISNYYARTRASGPGMAKPAQQAKPGDVLITGSRPAKLPTSLDQQLPSLPAPYTRLVLGSDVILVNRDNHSIVDVIPQIAY